MKRTLTLDAGNGSFSENGGQVYFYSIVFFSLLTILLMDVKNKPRCAATRNGRHLDHRIMTGYFEKNDAEVTSHLKTGKPIYSSSNTKALLS